MPPGEPPTLRSAAAAPLALEFGLLFVALPVVLTANHLPIPKIPLLLLVAYACERVLLRDPGFDRNALWNAEGFRKGARGVVLLFLATVPLLAGGVLLLEPDRFLTSRARGRRSGRLSCSSTRSYRSTRRD